MKTTLDPENLVLTVVVEQGDVFGDLEYTSNVPVRIQKTLAKSDMMPVRQVLERERRRLEECSEAAVG